MHSPLVVLGGGPGGYAAAFLAADEGLPVVLVEAESRLGGTCLLRGCIPSKALLHVAKVISEAQELHEWGVGFGAPSIDVDRVRARKEKVIATLSGGLAQLAKRRSVTVIRAKGVFENSTTLRLEGDRADADLRPLHSGYRQCACHAILLPDRWRPRHGLHRGPGPDRYP
jgi:dihydrolipoamide dehydrogenase